MCNSIKLIERNQDQNLWIQETARPLCFLHKEMEFRWVFLVFLFSLQQS
jgi:hypothetical protein